MNSHPFSPAGRSGSADSPGRFGQQARLAVGPTGAGAARPQALADDADVLLSPGWRILVVDDCDDAATSLSMLLKLFGHDPRVALSGLQALTQGHDFQPDAVLLDIGLPDLDGWEVARRIRATPWGSDCVLLALTGCDEPEDRKRSREADFDEHLVKPVEPESLLRKLAELLSCGAQARRQARAVALSSHWS